MNNSAQKTTFNDIPCIQLKAGGYEALIAYEIGSNVIRLQDRKNGMEFFRFNPEIVNELPSAPDGFGDIRLQFQYVF